MQEKKNEMQEHILQYKTARADISPQGNPRVFFCYHPREHKKYFDKLANQIFEAQDNAIIWYYDPEKELPSKEQMTADLREMQLLVVPVTVKFLTMLEYYKVGETNQQDPSFAAFAFQFARDHHIPILPLMQEGNANYRRNEKLLLKLERQLEEKKRMDASFDDSAEKEKIVANVKIWDAFSYICDNMQYLDEENNKADRTALPFEMKLRKFVNSVLVNSETIEKVQQAFEAYIFLSYRKTDRAQAQDVMRMIHQFEPFRDVAIWYDEFLIPGEAFTKGIEDALHKCQLFSMVVTPNLVTVPNYVYTTEYVLARDSDKSMLSIEAIDTDRAKYEAYYPKASTLVSGDEPELLNHYLHFYLDEKIGRERKQDPEHLYLIGLAYLTGIDMEINYAKAEELLREAADGGCLDALDRLVSMYLTGEGVERNYAKAVNWQRKYVEALRIAWEERQTSEALQKRLTQETDDLFTMLMEEKEWDEARDVAELSIRVSQSARAYEMLGDVLICRREYKGARENYEKALSLVAEKADLHHDSDTYVWRSTVHLLCQIGVTYRRFGDMYQAEKQYEKAQKLLTECKTKNRIPIREVLMEQSGIYALFGELRQADLLLEEAEHYFEMSTEVLLGNQSGYSSIDWKEAVNRSYEHESRIANATGNDKKFKQLLENRRKLQEEMAKEKTSASAQRGIKHLYHEMGDFYEKNGNLEEAQKYKLKEQDIISGLEKEAQIVKSSGKSYKKAKQESSFGKDLSKHSVFEMEKQSNVIDKLAADEKLQIPVQTAIEKEEKSTSSGVKQKKSDFQMDRKTEEKNDFSGEKPRTGKALGDTDAIDSAGMLDTVIEKQSKESGESLRKAKIHEMQYALQEQMEEADFFGEKADDLSISVGDYRVRGESGSESGEEVTVKISVEEKKEPSVLDTLAKKDENGLGLYHSDEKEISASPEEKDGGKAFEDYLEKGKGRMLVGSFGKDGGTAGNQQENLYVPQEQFQQICTRLRACISLVHSYIEEEEVFFVEWYRKKAGELYAELCGLDGFELFDSEATETSESSEAFFNAVREVSRQMQEMHRASEQYFSTQ